MVVIFCFVFPNRHQTNWFLVTLIGFTNFLWQSILQLKFHRIEKNGTLYVDDIEVDSGEPTGKPKFLDGLKTLYVGGVPEGFNSRRAPVSFETLQ